MKTKDQVLDVWHRFYAGQSSIEEYNKVVMTHQWWSMSYNDRVIIVHGTDGDDAFLKGMRKFQQIFGIFNVIEDDVRFGPYFPSDS